MLGGEDANRLRVAQRGGAADPFQLNAELISCQRSTITVVYVQHKKLIPREENINERLSRTNNKGLSHVYHICSRN